MPKGIYDRNPPRPPAPDDIQRKRSLQVRMMSSTRTSLPAMAELMGLTVPQLKRQYKAELKSGHDYVYAAISTKLVSSAFGGDMRAILAWLRQYGGWQEISRREITGKNGEPISFRNLDAAALASVIEALSSSSPPSRGAGRDGAQIGSGAREILDLEAISGPTDEGLE